MLYCWSHLRLAVSVATLCSDNTHGTTLLYSRASVHADWCRFMVEEVLFGRMAKDTNNNAVQAQKKARTVAQNQGWRYLTATS